MNKETTAELTAGNSSTYFYKVTMRNFQRKDILEPYEEGVKEYKDGLLWMDVFDDINLAIARIFHAMVYANSGEENISEHWRWNWMPSEKDMEFCFERKIQDGNTLITEYKEFTIKYEENKWLASKIEERKEWARRLQKND